MTAAGPDPMGDTGPTRLTLDRVLLAAFGLLIAATVLIQFRALHSYEFQGDDWRLFARGGSLGDYLQPYNKHLSAVPILVYRLLLETLGLNSAVALRLVSSLCFATLVVAVFFVVRSRLGSAVALVGAAATLWFHNLTLTPSAFNHWLALAATVVCAWALADPSSSRDLVVGLALGFALCSSGVGVAGAVGSVAYVVLAKSSWRRRAIVGSLAAAWLVWWLFISGNGSDGSHLSTADTARYIFDGAMGSFRGLVFGNQILGGVLAIAFAVYLLWRLRSGPRAACLELSWTAAFVFWWAGLAYSRGAFSVDAAGDISRYNLVGAVFVILAVAPSATRASLRTWSQSRTTEAVVTAVSLAVSLVLVVGNSGGVLDQASVLRQRSAHVRQQLIAANLGPAVVPDGAELQLGALALNPTAREYRHLVAAHGTPGGTRPAEPDATIVALGPIRLRAAGHDQFIRCDAVGSALRRAPNSTTILKAGTGAVVVELRRFGATWVPIGDIRAGTEAELDLQGLGSPVPWMIRARGACLQIPPPTAAPCAPGVGNTGGTVGPLITLPDAVGKNAFVVAADLKQAGLRTTVVSSHSATVARGTVLEQRLTAGTRVRAGACVGLVVSSGP